MGVLHKVKEKSAKSSINIISTHPIRGRGGGMSKRSGGNIGCEDKKIFMAFNRVKVFFKEKSERT